MPFIVVEIVVFCTFVIEKSCELCFLEVLCVQNDRICKRLRQYSFAYGRRICKNNEFWKTYSTRRYEFYVRMGKVFRSGFFWGRTSCRQSTKIEWFKPVFAEDVLTAKATVTALTPRSIKNGIAEVTIEAFNQRGEKVLSGITEAIVKNQL